MNEIDQRRKGRRKKSSSLMGNTFLSIILLYTFLFFVTIYITNDDSSIEDINPTMRSYSSAEQAPYEYLTMYGENRAIESLANLPGWIQNYVQWNKQQPADKSKYLVLICLPRDETCGGLSDRFRGLLSFLFLSKISNRKLCIYWTRPFSLQTFLLPTESGIDWRCPEDHLKKIINQNVPSGSQRGFHVNYFMDCLATSKHPEQPMIPCVQRELQNLLSNTETFAVAQFYGNTVPSINQFNLIAQAYSYEDMMPIINQWQYPDMMKDLFRAFFKPVPSLAKRVNETMTKLGLIENEYVSVHIRTRYPVRFYGVQRDEVNLVDKQGKLPFEGRVKDYLINILNNAVECGHLLAPDLPMFFTSDHNEVTKYATMTNFTFNGEESSITVKPVGIHHDKMPVHVGITEYQKYTHSDFYSVFEELLIMGGSRCVAHGMGSFGSFGAGLAGNTCRAVHRKHNGRPERCPNDRGIPKKMKILNDSYKPFKEESYGPWNHKLKCNIKAMHNDTTALN